MFGYIICLISGLVMSIQGVVNTETTKQTSMWVCASFVQFTALIICVLAWFFTGRNGSFLDIMKVRPLYMLTGGIMGAFITYSVIAGIDKLGPAKAILFIIFAQVISAYLIEVFGLLKVEKVTFHWTKALGIGIFLAGMLVFKWKDIFK